MSVALGLGLTPPDLRACTPGELTVLRAIYLHRRDAAEAQPNTPGGELDE